MAANKKEKESLLDHQRKIQEEQKQESQFKEQGRVTNRNSAVLQKCSNSILLHRFIPGILKLIPITGL
ncbi:hypothetical protein CU633_00735 [Bacillus sp. V3-13]|uniref:hypothetical protein n=1 Tax=Bacillus sp. V3-13 TaxID=2053728 RepID=UPI000C764839|nr:hypothetical protein [Bacillus sp. V3-13]PLR79290.1 hypothetical protein CU633_00735 [Bacillus sp. V3-13]